MAEVRTVPGWQDLVGGEHERVVIGCAVGAGVQRGANDRRAGEGGYDGTEGAKRGTLNKGLAGIGRGRVSGETKALWRSYNIRGCMLTCDY